jgi:hypothetical protein
VERLHGLGQRLGDGRQVGDDDGPAERPVLSCTLLDRHPDPLGIWPPADEVPQGGVPRPAGVDEGTIHVVVGQVAGDEALVVLVLELARQVGFVAVGVGGDVDVQKRPTAWPWTVVTRLDQALLKIGAEGPEGLAAGTADADEEEGMDHGEPPGCKGMGSVRAAPGRRCRIFRPVV